MTPPMIPTGEATAILPVAGSKPITVIGTEAIRRTFDARAALYARERAVMKDLPALLAAVLAKRDVALLSQIFPRVVDSPKMLPGAKSE